MNTAQQSITFPVPPVRNRIVRTGAITRYDEAIQYLREELRNGGWAPIKASEFSNTFKITGDFLHLCVTIGAIDSTSKKKGQPRCYKALPKLKTLTGQEVRDFRLEVFPNPPYILPEHLKNKTPEQQQTFIQAMNNMNAALVEKTHVTNEVTEELIKLGEMASQPTPTFLVGMVAKDKTLEASTFPNYQFSSLEDARHCVNNWVAAIGTKLVIVQVIEVVESAVLLQASTL